MTTGTHNYNDDDRNQNVRIYVNGEIVPRAEAKVSVLDAGFILGDGVWEGLRLKNGNLAFVDAHLERLYEGAKAIDLDIGLSPDEIKSEILRTTAANNMTDDIHIRLMVTRGLKTTPFQDPRASASGPTVVIIPEFKTPVPGTLDQGIRLHTVHVRRGRPDVLDPQINSHSKLNCITACIQATKAGADEALMLDPQGFVATCNSTHFFIVRKGQLWTSTGDYCLHGITRDNVLQLAQDNGLEVFEKNFSLTQVYSAEEAFVTGTFAGVAPVSEVDGRTIGSGQRGEITKRLQDLYVSLIAEDTA
ncbi:MAG: aminotransferase class IV [Alphaproteobacteria bacterium]|nr:aminotransferase class IV [Alphaproteobacteria bacterium]MBT4016463.1 aminotransferase class IV [Alphaproteobacteria bacterium]MBT5158986.1 aminotransferase class IV [Alphaproteobacteria bacterium]